MTGAPPTRERDPASGNPIARYICFKRAAHLMHFLAGPGALLSGPCPLAVSPAILCLQFRVVRTQKAPRLAVVSARGVALPVGTLFTGDRLVFRTVSVRRKRSWWCYWTLTYWLENLGNLVQYYLLIATPGCPVLLLPSVIF